MTKNPKALHVTQKTQSFSRMGKGNPKKLGYLWSFLHSKTFGTFSEGRKSLNVTRNDNAQRDPSKIWVIQWPENCTRYKEAILLKHSKMAGLGMCSRGASVLLSSLAGSHLKDKLEKM